jgi:hypothetical protein
MSILNSTGFSISNGVSTILALQAGFISLNTPKVYIIGALLSLLITDPLSDSYSIYIAMKDTDEKEARNKFLYTWLYQALVQLIFLLVIIVSPSMKISFIISSIIGSGLILYDYGKRFKEPLVILREYLMIIGLIIFTFMVEKIIVKKM